VLALDIAPEMLEYLDLRVKARKATNVTLRLVASDDPQLDPGGVDTILMIDAIHYVKDRVAYAKKLRPALAPGGRVVIIDYRPKPMSERPWGPPPEQQFRRSRWTRRWWLPASGCRRPSTSSRAVLRDLRAAVGPVPQPAPAARVHCANGL